MAFRGGQTHGFQGRLAKSCKANAHPYRPPMAKISNVPITSADLLEYLQGSSDFGFEIQILQMLTELDFACQHGGTYEDGATSKPRQFDIRAGAQLSDRDFVWLAVECKNLQPHCPLLVSCLPRRGEEAFHDIMQSWNPNTSPRESAFDTPVLRPHSKASRMYESGSFYRVGEPVGKSLDQVARHSSGELLGGDANVYDKWSQALSSARDLVSNAEEAYEIAGGPTRTLVFPMLVVPDGRLWSAEFDAAGALVKKPEPIERCAYFVGRNYSARGFPVGDDMTLSHLEIVTQTGLRNFLSTMFGTSEAVDAAFRVRSSPKRKQRGEQP
jgi:hypothetical protein